MEGALIAIDAIARNLTIPKAVNAQEAHLLLAINANQHSLNTEITYFFNTALPEIIQTHSKWEKGHGRVEHRVITVSSNINWMTGSKRKDGSNRLPGLKTLIALRATREIKGIQRIKTRFHASSATQTASAAHHVLRAH